MNLTTLATELITNGGFSYSLTFGDVFGTDNYSVAVAKDTEKVFDGLPSLLDIRKYVDLHLDLLMMNKFVLGGWEHEGKYYLDVAELLSKDDYTLRQAVSVGQDREQIAIFDLETGKEIKC